MEFYVISFESTHHAIMVEKKLKKEYKIDMIPTPREITASCGLSIRFQAALLKDIITDLKESDIDRDKLGIYKIEKIKDRRHAHKIQWGEN